MDYEDAKALLSTAVKYELRDHTFGDCEVTWYLKDRDSEFAAGEIASGYFGGSQNSVSVMTGECVGEVWKYQIFIGVEADALRNCFASEKIERNDKTGPDNFVLGRTMPGLTLEGARKELTGE